MDDRPASPFTRVYVATVFAGAIVCAAHLVSKAGVRSFLIHHAEKRVTVTGAATRRIKSDLVVWRATVKSQAPDMAAAYRKLAVDVPEVVAFVKAHGVDEKEIKVAAATIQELHPRDKEGREIPEETRAFVTTEEVEVSSKDIDKVELLADASKDARDRATQIATHAGGKITSLIVAHMGVMQVNPAYSTSVSSEGNNDKTSLEKDALAIVTASFAVE